MKEIKISDFDMIRYNSEFKLKVILQRRGMPFKGITNLELDTEQYIYIRRYDKENKETVYNWKALLKTKS